jgi:hypothetical protein
MPRNFYDEKTRTAIVGAVGAARKEGKKWAEAHAVAKGAGFRGGVPALQIFVRKSGGVKIRRRRRTKMAPATATVQQAPAVPPQNDIEAAIERIVQERVRIAIQRAVDVLKSAL